MGEREHTAFVWWDEPSSRATRLSHSGCARCHPPRPSRRRRSFAWIGGMQRGCLRVATHAHSVRGPPCTLEKIVFTNTMQFAVATTPMLATRAAVRPQASRAALVVRAEDVKPVMIGLAVGSSIISPAGIRSAVPGGGVCPTHGYRRRGHVVESFACSLHPPRIHRARSSADSDD